jgi:hypothetical protein
MKLAACGLDCDKCSLKPGKCDGCHANTNRIWSPDCKILHCCVFNKKLANCSECQDFPCPYVIEFESDQYAHHTAAIATLRKLAEDSTH